MRGTKYLSEMMKDVELSEEKNNLILAPIGSGKSNFAINVLSKNKKVLYLVDNSNLKEQILKEDFTNDSSESRELKGFGCTKIIVMTYKEFGARIRLDLNEEYINDFELIISDEIHSLVEYSEFKKDRDLSHAISFLMQIHKIPIVMFTATEYYLTLLCNDYPQLRDSFNEINFMESKDIRRYTELRKEYINHFSQVKTYLSKYESGFKYAGLKCLIYTKQIGDMIRLENMCIELGLTPICIWSIHNGQYSMNEEQKKVRDHLLNECELLDPYNVLIINKSSETGINIKDDDMKLCVVNSTNLTEITQSRGRIRRDIDLLVVRTKRVSLPPMELNLEDKYLNKWIIKDDIYKLIDSYKIMNANGTLIGVRGFKDILEKSGYKVLSRRKTINGERGYYYMIHNK